MIGVAPMKWLLIDDRFEYIGKRQSWSYYGQGRVFHEPQQQEYEVSYDEGDCITVEMDFDAHTIAYSKNGITCCGGGRGGVAHHDLHGRVCAAVSLYSSDNAVSLSNVAGSYIYDYEL